MSQRLPEWLGTQATRDLAQAGLQLPRIEIGSGIVSNIASLLAAHISTGRKLAVIGDTRTLAAAPVNISQGWQVTCMDLVDPHADEATVENIAQQVVGYDLLLAVGSGTINDLCKYASAQLGIPYAVVATAASMNGYASANASITVRGHKKTLPAQLPVAIFCDLEVIAAAPLRLTRSGLGDMLCRPCAQADWLLSHLLLGTPYDAHPFTWIAPLEQKLIENAGAIGKGERQALETLIQAQILSGLTMTFCSGSYPASQGEHMIAHMMEMAFAGRLPPSYHGEQIGVTTLWMLRQQEHLLSQSAVSFVPKRAEDLQQLTTLLGTEAAQEAIQAFHRKNALLSGKSTDSWANIRNPIRAVHTNPEMIEKALLQAGCATMPADIGWPEDNFATACRLARYTRERFTFLDLIPAA